MGGEYVSSPDIINRIHMMLSEEMNGRVADLLREHFPNRLGNKDDMGDFDKIVNKKKAQALLELEYPKIVKDSIRSARADLDNAYFNDSIDYQDYIGARHFIDSREDNVLNDFKQNGFQWRDPSPIWPYR